jgi:hypothetical protein
MRSYGRLNTGIVAVLIMACACNKSSDNNIPINPGMKAAFNFQPGTYWIYMDSITSQIDCFCVVQNIYAPKQPYQVNSDVTADLINIDMYEYTATNTNYSYDWQLQLYNSEIDIADYNRIGLLFSFTPLAKYPFTQGNIAINGGSYNIAYIDTVFHSYLLNGSNFRNVSRINHRSNLDTSSEGYYNYVFYINDSVGIVKMSLFNKSDTFDRILQMIRCNVKK